MSSLCVVQIEACPSRRRHIQPRISGWRNDGLRESRCLQLSSTVADVMRMNYPD